MGTWIVGLIVFGLLALAVYKIYKDRRAGKGCGCGCGASCSSCPSCLEPDRCLESDPTLKRLKKENH